MTDNIIDKAKAELNSRPIVAIDYLLEAFIRVRQGNTSFQISELLNLFCQAVLKSEGISEEFLVNSPTAHIFDKDLSQTNQRFIGVCLLRLLSANEKCFGLEGDFRIKAFRLFDDVFSSDLYPKLGIDIKQQTYEKEKRLKDFVSIIEKELSTTILSMNSLEMLHNFRQSLMQKINSQLFKTILWPFLPRHLLDIRMKEVFVTIDEYLDEKGPGIILAFKKANETLKDFLGEAEQHGSRYSCSYLGDLAKKLFDLLQKHFEASPYSKPAKLSINPSNKKYPFYSKGRDINLGFIVKNEGHGYAFDITLQMMADLLLERSEIYLGHLDPNCSIVAELPAKVSSPRESIDIIGELKWINFDKTIDRKDFDYKLEGQRSDIDWDNLANADPYSLRAVEEENELVGRAEILEQLVTQAQAESIGSSYIFGQKRVGKTSIVKTLKKLLSRLIPRDFLVVYLEGGDFVHPSAEITIENLGVKLCEEIKEADVRFRSLEIPAFHGALSPLDKFLRDILKVAPGYKILFILDEFDELPINLYQRGPVGDSFFLTLRSISGKGPFGFVLVGGEKMEFILSCQGDTLNRFQAIRVDYFDKEKHWSDFQDLIKKPVAQWLEISDEALTALHDQSAGNPYFAKMICKSLFNIMKDRRDCDVTI